MRWFELNENAILNQNASKGLPNNIGDLVNVVRYRPEFSQYNYEIRLPNGDIAFVKESELNKLTDKQKELITYIYKGNRVIYIPSNEEVTITKVDFIHNQVAIKFDDYGAIVVGFESLKELEKGSDSLEDTKFKFKVGDKVKIKTEDSWKGLEGVITESYKTYNDIGYDVSFGVEGETTCFNENELELLPNKYPWGNEEPKLIKTRTDLHRDTIEEIHNTFKIKNADYGNSFGEQYTEYGLLSAVIRLDDKMRRLKQLMKQDAQVKDESIRDTVLDLANYAIMTVMELDNTK